MRELKILMTILDISQASTVFEQGILPTVITSSRADVLSDFKGNYASIPISEERVAYYLHAIKSNEKIVGIIGQNGLFEKTVGNPTENAIIRVMNEDGTFREISMYQVMQDQLRTLRATEYEKQGVKL